MKQQGLVVKRMQNEVLVKVCRKAACEHNLDGNCVHGGEHDFFVTASDSTGVQPGQGVELTIASGKMLTTVLLVFWLPLILGGMGYWIAEASAARLSMEPAMWLNVLGAVFGVAVAIAGIVLVERRTTLSRRGFYVSKVIETKCGD